MFNQIGHHYWGMHWLWWIFWIIILLWIFLGPKPYSKKITKNESPLEILQKRYAKGELSKEEYEERKNILEEDMK